MYKINNGHFNKNRDYIFNTSSELAEVTVQMDQVGPTHRLQGQEAYFDGSLSRCIGSKALTLFVYHPAMHHILRIATTDVNLESR